MCDKTCIFCFFPIINKYLCMAKRSLLFRCPSYIIYARPMKVDYLRVRVGRATCEACSGNLEVSGTIPAVAVVHRETKKNLCRDGRSQGCSEKSVLQLVMFSSLCQAHFASQWSIFLQLFNDRFCAQQVRRSQRRRVTVQTYSQPQMFFCARCFQTLAVCK